MKATFTEIYRRNVWKFGSGEGALPKYAKPYKEFLEQFIRDRRIKSVVDYGCGDWQFSRLINWDGIRYLGLDLVDSLIEHHKRVYQTDNITFLALEETPTLLPDADLIILKDILQHWSNQSITLFMPKIVKYKFALITNCVNLRGETVNRDIPDGYFRPLDLREPPFSYDMKKVFEFTNNTENLEPREEARWRKVVLLQQNEAA